MSRRNRVQYADALYHVTSRGVHQADIFLNDHDRSSFFQRCALTVERFCWRVYAVVLMTNHFHLFFRTPEPNLCRGMHFLLSAYARSFNWRHGRAGHVLQSRYWCGVIETMEYAWAVSRYAHLNCCPVLAPRPELWPWSSYPGYCDQRLRLPWVQYDELLAAFQGEFGGDPIAGYRQYVEKFLETSCPSPFEQAERGWILGGGEFVERIRGLINPPREQEAMSRLALTAPLGLDRIIEAVCEVCQVGPERLRVKGRRGHARRILAHVARQCSNASLAEVAQALGLAGRDSVPGLIHQVESTPATDPLRRKLDLVHRRLRGG